MDKIKQIEQRVKGRIANVVDPEWHTNIPTEAEIIWDIIQEEFQSLLEPQIDKDMELTPVEISEAIFIADCGLHNVDPEVARKNPEILQPDGNWIGCMASLESTLKCFNRAVAQAAVKKALNHVIDNLPEPKTAGAWDYYHKLKKELRGE